MGGPPGPFCREGDSRLLPGMILAPPLSGRRDSHVAEMFLNRGWGVIPGGPLGLPLTRPRQDPPLQRLPERRLLGTSALEFPTILSSLPFPDGQVSGWPQPPASRIL